MTHPDVMALSVMRFPSRRKSVVVCLSIKDRNQRFQRFAAAILAISDRCSGVKAFARAWPPFNPPNRANSCAGVGGGGTDSVRAPLARSTIILASWFGSRGRLGCLSMDLLYRYDA